MTGPQKPRFEHRPRAHHFVDETLSILVFGPGHGEAIVVLFPDFTVGVIDGCREPRNGNPSGRGDPVREFLDDWHRLHAGATQGRLRFVALTHPHADHYAGLGWLIEAYDGLIDEIWCTLPTGGHYANAYVKYLQVCEDNPDMVPGAEDFTGLTRVWNSLTSNIDRLQLMQRGRHDVMMYETRMGEHWLRVRCIAPSHADLLLAQQDLMHTIMAIVESGDACRPRHDPNLTSAALLVSWGHSRVLLGGDLLCSQGRYEGWGRASSSIEGKVQVVKAAHHASEGAQDWELWRRMAPKLAIVTPFKYAASHHPPRPATLDRLVTSTAKIQLAITSPPQWPSGASPKPTRTVAQQPSIGRNSALKITASPPAQDDAVCVSLDAKGNIKQLLLTGRADLYR